MYGFFLLLFLTKLYSHPDIFKANLIQFNPAFVNKGHVQWKFLKYKTWKLSVKLGILKKIKQN